MWKMGASNFTSFGSQLYGTWNRGASWTEAQRPLGASAMLKKKRADKCEKLKGQQEIRMYLGAYIWTLLCGWKNQKPALGGRCSAAHNRHNRARTSSTLYVDKLTRHGSGHPQLSWRANANVPTRKYWCEWTGRKSGGNIRCLKLVPESHLPVMAAPQSARKGWKPRTCLPKENSLQKCGPWHFPTFLQNSNCLS